MILRTCSALPARAANISAVCFFSVTSAALFGGGGRLLTCTTQDKLRFQQANKIHFFVFAVVAQIESAVLLNALRQCWHRKRALTRHWK